MKTITNKVELYTIGIRVSQNLSSVKQATPEILPYPVDTDVWPYKMKDGRANTVLVRKTIPTRIRRASGSVI
jgi:hypothetical protein